ncbi:MAG TPA: PP2C family protein-serine/threonine phosphatase, partial [Phytomonospora sp.]
ILAAGRDESFASVTLVNQIALATVTAASVWVSRLRQSREHDLRQVRAIAETVQRVVLRPLPARLGRVDLHLLYHASAEHARVGGDFYKALRVGSGVRLMIGDVQGRGLPAVEMAALLVGSFREHAYAAADLPDLAARLERSIDRYVARAADSTVADRFATVLLAEIPDDAPVVRLLSLGHPPPLIQHDDTTRAVEFTRHSPPLNLRGLAAPEHRVEEVPFAPGDRLLAFTDGVTETRDADGVFYPLEERLRTWLRETDERVLPNLREDLAAHGGGDPDDDMTAILVVRRPPAAGWDRAAAHAGPPVNLRHRSAADAAVANRRTA